MKGCLYMSHYVNVSNSWKTTKQTYVNVSGSWKSCINIYVKASNEWKPLYNYWWATGDWSTCSATCGGGTQTRAVTCHRSHATNNALDQQAMTDTYCTKTVGTKPITQQSCNTQSCNECQYNANTYYWSACLWFVPTGPGTNAIEIVWNGTRVIYATADQLSVNNAYLVTTYTIGGYIYTRDALQSGNGQINISYYTVCRQPV